ncbi:MAG TPA: nitrilase family protein [Puia sp.]|nr:nitrilase family protein [Puia sp.]
MENLVIATAQFEHASGDKAFNLAVIDELSGKAAAQGARVVAFHECSVTGYSFARKLSREQLLTIAEPIPTGRGVPAGPSIERLIANARKHDITVLAGLFELDAGRVYKAYVCVDSRGVIAKHRKIHPFIHPDILPGTSYTVFDLHGWKCGILICYDNNIVENVRATALLGADIIFMPHVTMCTPSTRPGAGVVDPKLWVNRKTDPTSLRIEFDGLKGREWLMKWLPSRAYDNGIYVLFSNAIGMDDDHLHNGCSMILDPFGDIVAECRSMDNEIVLAVLTSEKLTQAGGYRYRKARKPELYGEIIARPHKAEQKVVWLNV